ncbi:MAG: glycosyltransferase, partial [Desulfobacula sp.]|uniref:glycosyltransferase n=1 Tax=Desulfobacula sp. TaxID=2593537 RepID=UPI0025C5587F
MNSFWKNKRVSAYIALKHHTRFIIPIMKAIADKGATVEYIVGQAERSQEITAIELNLNYSHIFDFIDDSDQDEIYKNYHIMRKGFAASLLKDKAFCLLVPTVLDKTLFAAAQEYIGFKNYFKKTKVDLCLALHETNRWGKIFAYHAKKKGVPFITFQEGLYSTASAFHDFANTGHAQYSTLNLVWGQRTKEKLSNYEAPEEKIISAGNTHITNEINRLKQNNIRKKMRQKHKHNNCYVVLLIFSINLIPKNELLPLLNIFQKDNTLHLYIKFHPANVRLDIDKWIDKIPKELKNRISFIHGEKNIYDLMAMSDLIVLTEGSTTGLEALAIGKPLIELKLESPITYDFSLAQENAAIKLTTKELAFAIEQKKDFTSMMNQAGIQHYLESELHESEKSIDNVTGIMESAIKANLLKKPAPLETKISSNMEWSIILPVVNNPDTFISILEAIAIHSENENYEVILIKPETIPDDTKKILQSLEGDVSILTMKKNHSFPAMLNIAGISAKGKNLIFLSKNIAPKKDWLNALKKGFDTFGKNKIYGAKIISRFNNIVHAGIVVDANNCPVSAYVHLDKDFPHTCKIRSFQMIDHFTAINKNQFLSIGGFNHLAEKYSFLDLSLRFENLFPDTQAVMYLPDIELVQAEPEQSCEEQDDSIFFYSKWHGHLWENENKLYQEDGVS